MPGNGESVDSGRHTSVGPVGIYNGVKAGGKGCSFFQNRAYPVTHRVLS